MADPLLRSWWGRFPGGAAAVAFHVEPTLEGSLTDSIHFRIQRNIAQFDGDPHDVAIAGQSAGGISVLAQLTSPSSSGPSCKADPSH